MIRKLLLSSVMVLLSVVAMAQSGTLQGKITDANSQEPIAFANVTVELGGKIIHGAVTDFDGNYKIKPIQPGTYDVKVTYVGYQTQLVKGVVIKPDKIEFMEFKLVSSATNLGEVVISTYKNPLIDKGSTSTGGTMTAEDIKNMPTRSAEGVAITVGGVFSDENGNMGGIRGSREGATATYIDGMRVIGSQALPKDAIDQVTVITGGTPAMYGDFTGGATVITTRGPSRQFGFGAEGVTSELLDGYHYNLIGLSTNGPLIKGKDSTKNTSLLGFFIAAEGSFVGDGSPASIGTYKVNDDKLTYLQQNPVRPTGTGFGSFNNSEFIHKDDLVKLHTRENAARMSANINAKVDIRTNDNSTLTFGGSYNFDQQTQWSIFNSLVNAENNGEARFNTYRVYGRFTQRFPTSKESTSLIKNVYYNVQADYSKTYSKFYNPLHQDNIFNYGYVGKFTTHSVKSYELGSDTVSGLNNVYIMNGYRDTLYEFQRSEINANLSNYTDQYYNLYNDNRFYANSLLVQNGGALLNGQLPNSIFGLYANTGTPYNTYRYAEQSRFGINAMGSADVGNHEFQFGIQYEQRKEANYAYNPAGLWTLMRSLANSHIKQLDFSNPILVYDQVGIFQDTVNYNRLYDASTQTYFDKQMREKLGLAENSLDWIDVDSYDPSTFNINMFSADELLNSGNPYVNYSGYDPYGNKHKSKPAFEDFFNEIDANGNHTRAVAAYEPIYVAGFIQDKFEFNEIIFNVGVRFDRFDANQKVLKDPYLLAEAKTVKELAANEFGAVPSNMGDDYVVYVNDIYNPTTIMGYRNGARWFDAKGTEISDPTAIQTASGIAPLLLDPNEKELKASAFTDYQPQNTISPRISFSFPISDEALFFAHYDVLTSRPTTGNDLPLINYYFINSLGNDVIDNPNLKAERTTDYELGFQQVISASSAITLSAYYRETRDQIQVFRYNSAYPVSYLSYNNIDFGTTKGFTIKYDLRRTKNLTLMTNYTLQFANATGSSATSGINLVTSGQPNLRVLNPISEDRNHSISLMADYRYGMGKEYNGPTIKRRVKGSNTVKVIRILENAGANITFMGGSGLPYSRQSNVTSALLGGGSPVLSGSINGSRLPWQFRADLKVDRDFLLKGKEGSKRVHVLNVYVQVLNLFNSQNITSVYRYTGNPDDDGYLNSAEYQSQIESYNDPQAFRDLYSTRINNHNNYSLPRRIRLGLTFSF